MICSGKSLVAFQTEYSDRRSFMKWVPNSVLEVITFSDCARAAVGLNRVRQRTLANAQDTSVVKAS
jgi:hypothetical protein